MKLDYSRIGLHLKRYSFASKVGFCYYNSMAVFDFSGLVPIKDLRKKILPWYLETFFLFCIVNKEVANARLEQDEFLKIIQCINKYHPPIQDGEKAQQVFAVMTLTQYDIQSPFINKFYRYSYFFHFKNNEINMDKVFESKFGADYDRYIELVGYLLLGFGENKNINYEILQYLVCEKYKDISQTLIISRDMYIEELKNFAENENDYAYCVRPSYTYAFIEDNGYLYLPLPHLLPRNITNSLLYKLTKDNDDIRSKLGTVFEHYVFDLINETNHFDEVFPEKKYKHHKDTFQTADVMCRLNTDYLFFECKLSEPRALFRNFDKASYQHEIDKLAQNVVQLYKSMKRFIQHEEYSPFIEKQKIDIKNLWGVVVVLEFSNIPLEKIYDKAAEILKITINSDDYIWICNHVALTDVSVIERYCFESLDFIKSLKRQEQSNQPYNYAFCESPEDVSFDGEKEPDSLNSFITHVSDLLKDVIDDLIAKGF